MGAGKRTRADALTKTPDGKLKIRESKFGPSARLSEKQKSMQSAVELGQPVIPRGQNAKDAGLEPGLPTIIDFFEVDWH